MKKLVFGMVQTRGTYTGLQYNEITKPRSSLVVVMFHKSDEGAENGLRPSNIIRTYGPKVGYEGPYLPR